MIDQIVEDKRHLITIIDPHIKFDPGYFVYKGIYEKQLYVLDANGNNPFVGNCWPNMSVWMDFFNPLCREYLKSLYTQIPENCEDKKNYIWTN
jgi:alpha 1,3-glucosidase